jgi:hypothetical protein
MGASFIPTHFANIQVFFFPSTTIFPKHLGLPRRFRSIVLVTEAVCRS